MPITRQVWRVLVRILLAWSNELEHFPRWSGFHSDRMHVSVDSTRPNVGLPLASSSKPPSTGSQTGFSYVSWAYVHISWAYNTLGLTLGIQSLVRGHIVNSEHENRLNIQYLSNKTRSNCINCSLFWHTAEQCYASIYLTSTNASITVIQPLNDNAWLRKGEGFWMMYPAPKHIQIHNNIIDNAFVWCRDVYYCNCLLDWA